MIKEGTRKDPRRIIDYEQYKEMIRLFLGDGMKTKKEIKIHCELSNNYFAYLLASVDWPLYESDDGRSLGWLKKIKKHLT